MSVTGRAEAPYPPGHVLFDAAAFPASFVNLSPIAVTWVRRLRTKNTLSFQTDADETPEATTEYFVRHGPHNPALKTEVNMGSGTSGSFNFDFAGLNEIEVYAKKDGKVSNILKFTTTALNGSGVSAGGPIGTVNLTAPHIAVRITAGGPIGTIGVTPAIIPHVMGNIGQVNVTGITGAALVLAGGSIGSVAVLAISGTISVSANASGNIGTVTGTAPTGMEEVDATASGTIGSVAVNPITGTIRIPASLSGTIGTATVSAITGFSAVSVVASGGLATVTASGISGVATGGVAAQEFMLPMIGAVDVDGQGGQYMLPLGGAVDDE